MTRLLKREQEDSIQFLSTSSKNPLEQEENFNLDIQPKIQELKTFKIMVLGESNYEKKKLIDAMFPSNKETENFYSNIVNKKTEY